MQNNKKVLMIASGIALLLLVVTGAFYFGRKTSEPAERTLVSPRATEEPTPKATETPTPTQSPTPSTKPTATPTIKPTATPTSTPSPSPTPGVVNIETSVSPSGTTTTCSSQTFTFTAKIYTNAATTVKYTWLRSDNATGPEQTITFTGAGMQSITDTWTMSQSSGTQYNGWKRVKVTVPNEALSNQAEFTLACP